MGKNRRTFVTALFLILGLTGCRIGNRIEQAAQPDTLSGLYGAEAKSFEACVVLSDDTVSCTPANTNLVPSEIGAVFSNPVGFIVDDTTGEAMFTNPFYSSDKAPWLPSFIDVTTRKIQYSGKDTESVVLTDWLPEEVNDCMVQLELNEEGALVDQDKGKVMYDAELSGRIQLSVEVLRVFAPIPDRPDECLAMREYLEDCYSDLNLCMGTGTPQNTARRAEVAGIYQLFVETNLIQPSQISDVVARYYKVTYE